MADSIKNTGLTQSEEFYHTNFPNSLDDVTEHGLMQDVDTDMIAQYKIYENQLASGQSQAAYNTAYTNVNGKRLADALFNADKYNWIRDSILSMQDFFLNKFDNYIAKKTQEVVGSSDDEDDPSSGAAAYTIDKVNELLFTEKHYVPLLVSNWTQDSLTKLYKQSVSVSGIYSNREYVRHPLLNKEYDISTLSFSDISMTATQVKKYNKLYACLCNGEVNANGIATFYAFKLPSETFSIMLKRV